MARWRGGKGQGLGAERESVWYGGQWLDAMRSNGRLCWDFFFLVERFYEVGFAERICGTL